MTFEAIPIPQKQTIATKVIGSLTISITAMTSPASGVKTTAILAILSGQCGTTRTLEVYENPLGNRLVAISDIAVIVAIVSVLIAFGFIRSRKEDRDLPTICANYFVIDVICGTWTIFTPAIIISFFQYSQNAYEILSCLIGLLYITIVLTFIIACVFSVEHERHPHTDSSWLKTYIWEKPVSWNGEQVVVQVVDGYTSKFAILTDFAIMLVLTGTTMVNDCDILAYTTIAINALHTCLLAYSDCFQPRVLSHANMVFSLGQTICLLMYAAGVSDEASMAIVYATSFLSMFLTVSPFVFRIREMVNHERHAGDDVDKMIESDIALLLMPDVNTSLSLQKEYVSSARC